MIKSKDALHPVRRPCGMMDGRPVIMPRPPYSSSGLCASSQDRTLYHLAPINNALATVAAPDVPSVPQPPPLHTPLPPALPLVPLSAAAARSLVSSEAVTRPVQMWPAVRSSRQRRRLAAHESKAPLALQLEAFIRREHQQYLREHPTCSRTDCLHIFREAFNTFVNHFSEFRGVLSIIQDEYDAALNEMAERVKKMKVEYLESQADREMHAMELMQLKESMNATISNQKAQLSSTQELVHAMRDQLTAAEHTNALMASEMEQRRKTYMEAQQQVKLLSHAMIEESARTAMAREATTKLEKQCQLQEARIKVLKENVVELEGTVRQQAYMQMAGGSFAATPEPTEQEQLRSSLKAPWLPDDSGDAAGSRYTKNYVTSLFTRIDELKMKLAASTKKPVRARGAPSVTLVDSDQQSGAAVPSIEDNIVTSTKAAPGHVNIADGVFPVIREWLRREGVGEAEVEPTDRIVPPGRCSTEIMGFLAATQPVKHLHLSLDAALRLLESMWTARERTANASRLSQFYLDWIQSQAGDKAQAKTLGINILHTCQQNFHHPDCRALLAILRGYLPEELVHTGRSRLRQLRLSVSKSTTIMQGKMPFDNFFSEVRAICPEKSLANMLQLRFTLYHQQTQRDNVDAESMLDDGSYFLSLFKQQWVQEVEDFTLRVVEGIREQGDTKRNTVSLVKACAVLHTLDPLLSEEEAHLYVSLASQRSVIDVASAADSVTVPLDSLLLRFRTSVLLYRRSPEDILHH